MVFIYIIESQILWKAFYKLSGICKRQCLYGNRTIYKHDFIRDTKFNNLFYFDKYLLKALNIDSIYGIIVMRKFSRMK